ncbi:hypothetical protein LTR74_015371 [Friedmanniomyces endolithicus]|nr:hypothetical protein LTR74_015371 [Friedmanniomyces endolithicus]
MSDMSSVLHEDSRLLHSTPATSIVSSGSPTQERVPYCRTPWLSDTESTENETCAISPPPRFEKHQQEESSAEHVAARVKEVGESEEEDRDQVDDMDEVDAEVEDRDGVNEVEEVAEVEVEDRVETDETEEAGEVVEVEVNKRNRVEGVNNVGDVDDMDDNEEEEEEEVEEDEDEDGEDEGEVVIIETCLPICQGHWCLEDSASRDATAGQLLPDLLQFDPCPRAGEPMVSRRTPDYFL